MRWTLTVVTALLASPTIAQDVSGGYMGATIGNVTYTDRADGLVNQSDFDGSASTIRLYGGYRLGGRLALELGYAETGAIDDRVNMDLGGIVPVDITSDFAVTTARALIHFPIGAERLPFVGLSVFAGAGVYDADLKSTGSVAGAVAASSSEDGSTALLGVQVDFPKVSIRGEYEWFDTQSSIDLWTAGVGAIFRF